MRLLHGFVGKEDGKRPDTARPGEDAARQRASVEWGKPVSPRRDRSGQDQGRCARHRDRAPFKMPCGHPRLNLRNRDPDLLRECGFGRRSDQDMAEIAAAFQGSGKCDQGRRGRRPISAGLHRLAAVNVAPMHRAGATRPACFGLMIEYPGGLEIAVLRGPQPHSQGENGSDKITQSRHAGEPMGE